MFDILRRACHTATTIKEEDELMTNVSGILHDETRKHTHHHSSWIWIWDASIFAHKRNILQEGVRKMRSFVWFDEQHQVWARVVMVH